MGAAQGPSCRQDMVAQLAGGVSGPPQANAGSRQGDQHLRLSVPPVSETHGGVRHSAVYNGREGGRAGLPDRWGLPATQPGPALT